MNFNWYSRLMNLSLEISETTQFLVAIFTLIMYER